MPDIFDEVEEDLRADRARRLLLRYGGLVVVLLVLVVATVAGYQYWSWNRARSTAAIAEKFLAATREPPKGVTRDAALAQLDTVIAGAGGGYRNLARLRKAGLLADAGDMSGASALWDQVAADGAADPALRDVADLQWVLHNLDAGPPEIVRARLSRLNAPGNAWHGLANEASALLDIRQGRVDAARDTLRLLAQDTGAPDGVRRRAGGLLDQLGRMDGATKANPS